MNLRKLASARSAVLILAGLGLIVAGIWLVAADLFGTVIGGGIGLAASGLALLIVEWGSGQ